MQKPLPETSKNDKTKNN